jgi:molecular chaperone GrpE
MVFKGKKSKEGDNSGSTEARETDADFSVLDNEEDGPGAGQSGNDDSLVASLTAEADEYKNKYLRSLAEFENYKKRALKERSDLLKYQGEKVLTDILPVLDNMELALGHASAEDSKLREGIELIHKMFVDILAKWSVKAHSGLGKPFDPAHQQAISRLELDDVEPNTVFQELKKAYFYHDRLLRPGEVVVAVARQPIEGGHLPQEANKEEESASEGD